MERKNTAEVINQLVEENKGLVYHMLNKYSHSISDWSEAEDLAMEALLNAAIYFDVEKGYQFSSYACQAIRNAILYHLRTQTDYNHRFKANVIVEDKKGREVDMAEILTEELDNDLDGYRPDHRKDPLALLLEKERKHVVKETVDEFVWRGNAHLNTFIDFYYRDEKVAETEVAEASCLSQPCVNHRLINVKKETGRNRKVIQEFKQQLQSVY